MRATDATGQHPFGLLEAYALNALEPGEEQAVTDHVEGCPTCCDLLEENLRVASALSSDMPRHTPPASLRARILASVDLEQAPAPRVSVSHPRPSRSWAGVVSVVSGRWARVLIPSAAVLVIAIVATVVTMDLQMTGQMDSVEAENTQLRQQLDQSNATTAALSRSSSVITHMQGNLQRWQETSYALAQPGNQTLIMSPAHPGVESQGVLVMSEDGREAVLMASDLMPPQPDTAYHVWLTQGAQWFWAGEMNVDERGWGTMPLLTQASLHNYDSVRVSRGMGVAAARAAAVGSEEMARATAGMVGDMVLVASLR